MLEALIRTKNSACADKRAGDVICVKLKEFADWGAMEQRVHTVLDWQDEELETAMREKLTETGVPPVRVTPYKECQYHSILNDDGNKIFEGEITKTRSKKYFNIELGQQEEKQESQILEEFEQNIQFTKNECLKDKPCPPIGNQITISNNEQYLKYLEDMKINLSKYGIKTEIIDGKLVRV